MQKSTQWIIGGTFGMDIPEVTECRYQPTRTTRAIYSMGQCYYAVGKRPPKDDMGAPWMKHKDQFFAERAGTILWVSCQETNKPT